MHRRRKKSENKRKKDRSPSNRLSDRAIAILTIIVAIVFMVALYIVVRGSVTNYMQCFDSESKIEYSYTAKIFIAVGEDSEEKFIRIPEMIGVKQTCSWPITTGGDTSGERGGNWTAVHVNSPYVHDYTLGDFFRVWSDTIHTTVDFGPGGVGAVVGRTMVSYNFGPEQVADSSMEFHSNDWIVIRVRPG